MVKEQTNLWAVVRPEGDIIHTTINTCREEAINSYVEDEEFVNLVANMGRKKRGEDSLPSKKWEDFEEEGFSTIQVKILKNKND